MNVTLMLTDSLLTDRQVRTLALPTLLHFWRAWRFRLPRYAFFDDAALETVTNNSDWRYPMTWNDELQRHEVHLPPDPQPRIAALHRRRALWQRIEPILDLPDEIEAANALGLLVNGPDADDLVPFFFSVDGLDDGVNDPLYLAYTDAVLIPFLRHVRPRLTPVES